MLVVGFESRAGPSCPAFTQNEICINKIKKLPNFMNAPKAKIKYLKPTTVYKRLVLA